MVATYYVPSYSLTKVLYSYGPEAEEGSQFRGLISWEENFSMIKIKSYGEILK